MFYKIVIPLFIVLAAWSCEKNSDDTVEIKNTHRIKEYVYDHENNLNDEKQVFDYENEKLVRIQYYAKDESNTWYLNSKDTITYSGGLYTVSNYILEGSSYHNFSKLEMKMNNGKIAEENCYLINIEENWDTLWSMTYSYTGKNLSMWLYYLDNENGTLMLKSRGAYTYSEDTLRSITLAYTSGLWHGNDDKETIYYKYSANRLLKVVRYYKNVIWLEKSKIEYAYMNESISEADTYTAAYNGEWIYEKNITFDYDEYSNWMGCATTDYTITNVYEEGHGNASLFFYDKQDLEEGGPAIKNAIKKSRIPVPYIAKVSKGLINLGR